MKTFPVTIDTLKWSHLLRALGVILGLVSVFAMTYTVLLIGPNEYLRGGGFASFAYTSIVFLFGLCLILPRRFLNRKKVTKYIYFAVGGAYMLRFISAAIMTFKRAELTEAYVAVAVVFGILLIVIGNMKIFLKNCEPAGAGQPDNPPVKL